MAISPQTSTIGIVGTGHMGSEVARLFINAGYQVLVNNRHKEKAQSVIKDGAQWVDTSAALAQQSDVILTLVGFPEEVEDLYLGDNSLLDNARPGTYLVDMTTSSPKLAHVISTMAEVNDLHGLDAPMAGGELAARRGALMLMVGGEKEDYEALKPVFDLMSSSCSYVGEAGMGQLMKLATTITYADTLMGVVETLSFARATHLDENRLREVVRGSNVDSSVFENQIPKMMADELDDGIRVKHFCKDLGLALQVAESYELTLPGLDVANSLYNLLNTAGGAELATQALILIYSDEETCFAHGLDWDEANEGGMAPEQGEEQEGYTYHRRHHRTN